MTIYTLQAPRAEEIQKPYDELNLTEETRKGMDAIFDRIVASGDRMDLRRAGQHHKVDEIGGGLCILAAPNFTLFYDPADGSNKNRFFYSRRAFCLIDPKPGEYWVFGSHGAFWAKPSDQENAIQLHKNFWKAYPEKQKPPKKPGKSSGNGGGDDDGGNGSPPVLSPKILEEMGL
jgi:hypothetical protein